MDQAAAYADFDSAREPQEFLREIYKEANNSQQDPDARISKVLGKCSALFVRLSADQQRAARKLEKLTWVLIVLPAAITLLTVILCYDVYEKRQHDNAAIKTVVAK